MSVFAYTQCTDCNMGNTKMRSIVKIFLMTSLTACFFCSLSKSATTEQWHVKAVTADGTTYPIKAFYNIGKIYDVKAIVRPRG